MGIKSEFTKYDLYEIISSKDDLAYYLPPTGLFNDFEDTLRFIEDYKKVILRPIHISRGSEGCIIEKFDDNFKITDFRHQKQTKLILSSVEELKSFFDSNENELNKYIVQKLIKSVRIEQASSDVIVVMKKGSKSDWYCSEIEYRAGGSSFLLMNICNEQYAGPISDTIKKSYPLKFDFMKIIKEIDMLCIKTCKTIESIIENQNDIKFEIAIDEENKPWFIGIDIIKSMKKFKVIDYNIYSSFKNTPLLYSISLYRFKI